MKNKIIRKMGIYVLVGTLTVVPTASLIVSPMTVYAAEDVASGQTVTENTVYIGTNDGTVTTNNYVIDDNNGTIVTNNNNVYSNDGAIVTNNGGKDAYCNLGVVENNGTITTNSSTGIVEMNNPSGNITTNNGTINSNTGGNIETNNGTVKTNTLGHDEDGSPVAGVITTNNQTVEKNVCGTITTNNGTVNENVGESEHKGTITTNSSTGVVTNNNNCGVVSTNDGTIKANYGEVVTNNGTLEENKKELYKGTGKVTTNNGTIETNNGRVTTNSNDGTISINTNVGSVDYNYGTIDANNGTTYNNYGNGTIKTNTGEVIANSGTIKKNTGTVQANVGTVEDNYGTVSTNSGAILRQWYKLIVSNFNDFKFGSDASQTTVSSLQVGGKDTKTESDDTYDYYILDGKSAYVYAADSVTKVIIPDASDATIASLLESGNLVYDETKDAWKISGVNSSTGSLALNAQNIATLPSNVAEAGVTVSAQKSLVTNGVVDTTAGNEGKITSNGSEVPYFTSGTKVKIDGPAFDPSSATISGGPTIEFLSLEGAPMELSSGTGYVAEAFHKKKDNTFTYDVALVMPNATAGYAWACEYDSEADKYIFTQVKLPVAPSSPVDNVVTEEPVADEDSVVNKESVVNKTVQKEQNTVAVSNLNAILPVSKEAPTTVSSVSIQANNANPTSTAQAVTATVDVKTVNGNVNISPQMISGLQNMVSDQLGENVSRSIDIKVNAVAQDGAPVSIVVNSSNLKNNTTLKAYVLDPLTGGYIMTSVPSVKFNATTGLTLNGLAGGSTYSFVSAKEAKVIEQNIMNSVQVSSQFAKPVEAAVGGEIDMSQALSSSLNMANVSKISYTVSGNKAVIYPATGLLVINGNATKGTITVSIKVTLKNGKTKTIKTKIKIS